MNKRLIIFFLFLFLLLFAIVFVIFTNRKSITLEPSQIPSQGVTTSKKELTLMSSTPTEGAVVPIDTRIIQMTFSEPIDKKAIRTVLTEEGTNGPLSVQSNVTGNELKLTTARFLGPDREYTVVVRIADGGVRQYQLRFRTAKGEQIDTAPIGFAEEEQEWNRINRPDIYIANQVPYTTSAFKIESSITQEGNIVFIVTGKGTRDSLQNAVNAWFDEINVPLGSRSQLQVQYQPQ